MKKCKLFAVVALASANCVFAQKSKTDSLAKTKTIDEVVLVGYGTQKKSSYAGSSTNLDQKALKAIKDLPAVNLVSSIQGAMPGVTIISRPGDVGSNPASMNIRGRGTTDGVGGPMYIIDGVVSSSSDFYRINSKDIENLSVLKDASAAIYGNRAAYGVVLVTTKKGASGKMTVNYDGTYSLQSPTYLPNYVGSVDYMTLKNEAYTNAGKPAVFSPEQIEMARSGKYPDLYPNNNWFDLVLQKMAAINEHSLSVSGGNGGTRYYVSAGYLDQESLIPTKNLNRYSFRTNLDSKVSEKFKLGTNISFIKEDLKNSGGDFSFVSLQRMVPTMVAIHSDGTYGSINAGNADATLGKDNPLRAIRESGSSGKEIYKMTGALTGTYTPMKGLSFDGLFSYKFNFNRDYGFLASVPNLVNFITQSVINNTALNTPNSYSESWYKNSSMLSQLVANYEKTFDRHYLKLMAGTSFEKTDGRYMIGKRKNYPINFLNSIDAGSDADGSQFANGGYDGSNRSILSYFARLNYTFADKYILETVFRADNSSQFAPGYRWGYFPGVMAAWVISKENFMADGPFNNLKLRLSYGKTGNIGDSVHNFDYLEVLYKNSGAILDEAIQDTYYPGQFINKAFSWETVTTKNIGLDATLLNRRLSLTLDVYDRVTNGILTRVPLVDELGAITNKNRNDWPIKNIKDVDNILFP